jgi:formamidopyrimidine-DNA glycosylase
MPELPEVETICNGLRLGGFGQPSILGRTIHSANVFWPKSIQTPKLDEFHGMLSGQRIREISRRGKFILIHLDKYVLIIHLRMSGDLQVRMDGDALETHDRVEFVFAEGGRLVFNDTRKFGRIWLVGDESQVTGSLGPEPFDENLTGEQLFSMLQGSSRQIKPLLLDQEFLAGLGNIYSDEALFLAKIHPLRIARMVDAREATRLLETIRQVLNEGILHHGASIDWVYRGGDFQNYFRVYRRTGKPCVVCQVPIERIIVGQRSTHFCPKCQEYP